MHKLYGIVILDLSFNSLENIDPILNILPTTEESNITNVLSTEIEPPPSQFKLPIEQLSLWHNEIELNQVEKLAKILTTNETLHKLNIAENNIGNDGAIILAKQLECNTTLETLELFGNNISSLGAIALCNLLEKFNASIILLDLRFNLITSQPISDRFINLIDIRKERFNMLSFIVKLSYQSAYTLNEEELMFLNDKPTLENYEVKEKPQPTKKLPRNKKRKKKRIYTYDDDNIDSTFDVDAYIEYSKRMIKQKEREALIQKNRVERWKHALYEWYMKKKNAVAAKFANYNKNAQA